MRYYREGVRVYEDIGDPEQILICLAYDITKAKRVVEAFRTQEKAEAKAEEGNYVCSWRLVEDGRWETQCGHEASTSEGKYCCHCRLERIIKK